MKSLIVLVKMQLKEKLNFKRRELADVSLFRIALATVLAILKFALVTVLCVAFLLLANILGLFSINNTVPATVISLVFAVMLVTSVISCTAGLTNAMYYSRDNAILLTLPCRSMQVYLSKLIIFFVFELKRNFGFIVPLFVAYFYTHNYPLIFYPWLLFGFIGVSLFTVSLGALFSIPAMWLCNFFRQRKTLQMISLFAVLAAAYAALMFAISLIPENIDLLATWDKTFYQIQDFLAAYANNFAWFYDMSKLLLGDSYFYIVTFKSGAMLVRLLTLAGITAALFVLGLLIVRPLFYKMASKPFEYLKQKVKPKKNRLVPSGMTTLCIELRSMCKSIDRVFSNTFVLISIPLLIFLLNKIFLAMNTRALGDHMVVAFNILIILLVALNTNCGMASIYSKDGRSIYLIKTQPSDAYPLLLSRLIPGALVVFLSLAATFVILLFTAKLGLAETLLLMLGLCLIYVAHLFFCAEKDIMNPQAEVYATVGSYDNNPNELKATVSAFITSFAVAAAVLLLLIEGRPFVYVKIFFVGLLAALYCAWSFYSKVKLYYKEK